ncbi:class I SAM-dependent methyltransferase [Amycolatopsis anabasis]|uniref:methyltransferase domain-containing protein n=1 Tax=Amycolatopsis anabasis TaxID=1840409 RepID=UPI00131E3B1D|nr:class I SAM-dependent methyltransferase [Amycolatopsis anabasis]
MSVLTGSEFDSALLGGRCWLELATGEHVELPVHRWRGEARDGDEAMLGRCTGPTLDIGCGPGRMTAALTERGVVALGVDVSPTAVALTRRRGAVALRRNVFDPLPGEGRWRHVLLADGNIGIGGDPVALLRRVARLLGGDGSALVEVDPPGHGLRRDRVRVHRDVHGPGTWFTWAWLGTDAVAEVARHAALHLRWTGRHGHRWFAELVRS